MKSTIILKLLLVFLTCSCNPIEGSFKNYEQKEKEIKELTAFFKTIIPKDHLVFIRFNSDNNIDFKVDQINFMEKDSWKTNSLFTKYGQFHRWDVPFENRDLNQVIDFINWDMGKIDELRDKLKNANCISVGTRFETISKERVLAISIEYPTYELYSLSYKIFDKQLNEISFNQLQERCNLKSINKEVFLEYGGYARGSNCFPDER